MRRAQPGALIHVKLFPRVCFLRQTRAAGSGAGLVRTTRFAKDGIWSPSLCSIASCCVIRWETGADAASFSRTLTPDQIMDKLEERVGPEGRKLFEKFIRQVNVLQAKQQLEAQAQMGDTERSGERGPV
jgi:hypothetical protein